MISNNLSMQIEFLFARFCPLQLWLASGTLQAFSSMCTKRLLSHISLNVPI